MALVNTGIAAATELVILFNDSSNTRVSILDAIPYSQGPLPAISLQDYQQLSLADAQSRKDILLLYCNEKYVGFGNAPITNDFSVEDTDNCPVNAGHPIVYQNAIEKESTKQELNIILYDHLTGTLLPTRTYFITAEVFSIDAEGQGVESAVALSWTEQGATWEDLPSGEPVFEALTGRETGWHTIISEQFTVNAAENPIYSQLDLVMISFGGTIKIRNVVIREIA